MVVKSLIPPGRKKVVRKAVSDGNKKPFGKSPAQEGLRKRGEEKPVEPIPVKKAAKKPANLTPQKLEQLGMELVGAIKRKDEKRMQELINKGASPNFTRKNDHGDMETVLQTAVRNDFSKGVVVLLENGADPNTGFDVEERINIIKYRDTSISKALILSGMDLEIEFEGRYNSGIETPLSGAIDVDYPKYGLIRLIILEMVKKGINIDKVHRGKTYPTPLFMLCGKANPDFESIRLLVENGADVDARTKWGTTILHNIVNVMYPDEKKFKEIEKLIQYLVDNDADVNAISNNGTSILEIAKKVKENHEQYRLNHQGFSVERIEEWIKTSEKLIEFLEKLGAR